MIRKIVLGLLQYPIFQNPRQNSLQVFRLLNQLVHRHPHYVVLPEMWLGGPKNPSERKAWASFYQSATSQLKAWCREQRIGCYFSQLEEKKGKYYNTAYFIERNGNVSGKYRKIHLFSYGGETKIYSAGSAPCPPHRKIGLAICYDIRFPELIRHLAIKGASLLLVCAQWPQVRREHWLTLLRARAIENQIFVVGVNRLGNKGKINFSGDSVVFSPWGETLLHLDSRKQFGICEINLADVEKIRKKFPFFYERRF